MDQKQYVFPARFVSEDNGSVSVYFPDLDGCQTYDDTMSGAAIMAKDALEGYIGTLLESDIPIPEPTDINKINSQDAIVMMVVADVANILKKTDRLKRRSVYQSGWIEKLRKLI